MPLGTPIRWLDIALGLVGAAALLSGGRAAVSGVGIFAHALLPQMAAEARPPARDFARLTFSEGFGASRYSPQVLFPVNGSPFPEWLTEGPLVRLSPPPLHPAAPRLASAPGVPSGAPHPVIAICIDDLGEDIAGTDRAMALPRAVALSFLPFAEATPFLAAEASRRGHTILAHVPMQAVSATNPGPMSLMVGMPAAEIARRTEYALNRVPDLAGINNHEGSRFTADAAGLVPVVAALKARHLFFFDSRTGTNSKVRAVAEAAGVETASRDIFLDDDQSPAAVAASLEALARQARATGVAIAIGHPHDTTLRLLAAWLAQDHGVTLVSLPEAMRLSRARVTALASR